MHENASNQRAYFQEFLGTFVEPLSSKQERATFTKDHEKYVSIESKKILKIIKVPNGNANMLGSVLPIQNGR